MTISNKPVCWCGNSDLELFSKDYMLCNQCKTLVLSQPVLENINNGLDDCNFYGKDYWFTHQEVDLGFSNIISRARTDFSERIVYWLKTLLKYKSPPGETLELGCSHGGFVFALQMAGFNATGLELSPWVVNFAQQCFKVPMLLGDIENQKIPDNSLDVIILMDVLEHLPDPFRTISYCLKLLKPDGLLLIQTPQYPEGKSYSEMVQETSPFMQMLQPMEHIYLFSKESIIKFFNKLGKLNLSFEKAYFDSTDMFLVASKSPLKSYTQQETDNFLESIPTGRIILALLDQDSRIKESEDDRSARLVQIKQLTQWLKESEDDRSARFDQIQQLTKLLKESEDDRSNRWDQIQQYSKWLKKCEAEQAKLKKK